MTFSFNRIIWTSVFILGLAIIGVLAIKAQEPSQAELEASAVAELNEAFIQSVSDAVEQDDTVITYMFCNIDLAVVEDEFITAIGMSPAGTTCTEAVENIDLAESPEEVISAFVKLARDHGIQVSVN